MVLHTLASKLPKPEPVEPAKPSKSKAQLACEGKGGTWDGKKCILPEKPEVKPEPLQAPGVFREEGELKGVEKGKEIVFNPDGTVSVSRGGETITLSKEEYEVAELGKAGIITRKVRQAQALDPAVREQLELEQQQQQVGEELVEEVGVFEPTAIEQTELDWKEAATAGAINSIPSALGFAVTGVGVGLAGGPVGAVGGGAAGLAGGFVSGMASGMSTSFKEQRTDITTAQQRVLDEGKQNLNDLASAAAGDPSNRAKYLELYNKQSQLIDEAYRQMVLDTNEDVAKWETALPNLAEFETFYSEGGERDVLDIKMQTALQQPYTTDYDMVELSNRRRTS